MSNEIEAIKHLSKEIATDTATMMTFRARIAFAVFVGPYVLLGSYILGTKDLPTIPFNRWYSVAAALVGFLGYIGIGLICAKIEGNSWTQRNKFREEIRRLCVPDQASSTKEPTAYFAPHKLTLAYSLAYGFMYLLFVCAVLVLSK